MRIVRTFHPVGQGAFYSERFYDDNQQDAIHNIVYDCGTLLGYIRNAKKVVSKAFDKNDVIDYLFISHLDYDHISLVDTLLSSVGGVRNIVLPLIAIDELQVEMAYQKMSDNSVGAVSFLQRIINHLNGQYRNDYWNGDYKILYVRDEEAANIGVGNAGHWINGTQRQISNIPDWILIPYNLEYHSRKSELIKQFEAVVTGEEFINEINRIGETTIQDGDEFYRRLTDPVFVRKVINNTKLKNKIKKAYEDIEGGTNENSLMLYSGPMNELDKYRMHTYKPFCIGRFYDSFRAGCLYTGDNNFDISKWEKTIYKIVWDNIGTIQIPHHGSLDSFTVVNNPIERRYIFPVSFGTKNTFGHPSGKVLAYLISKNGTPIFVTEMSDKIHLQLIEHCN